MDSLTFYAPISKTDAKQHMVYGYASTQALDSQGEVVSKQAISDALDDYMEWANVREMHQPSAVGKTKKAQLDAKGLYVGIKVVDDNAWKKVEEGVYNGFSIGGKVKVQKGNEITALTLSEISLVDRPANPEAKFDVWKGEDIKQETKAIEGKAEAKAEKIEEVKKSLYDVADLAGIINQLKCLEDYMEMEGMESADKINATVNELFATLKDMVVEEETKETKEETPVGENMVAMAEKTEDLAKVDEAKVEDKKEEKVEEKPVEEKKEETKVEETKVEEKPVEEKKEEVKVEEKPAEEVKEEKKEDAFDLKKLEENLHKGLMPTETELPEVLKLMEVEDNQANRDIVKMELAKKILAYVQEAITKKYEEDKAKAEGAKAEIEKVGRAISATNGEKISEAMKRLAEAIKVLEEMMLPKEQKDEEEAGRTELKPGQGSTGWGASQVNPEGKPEGLKNPEEKAEQPLDIAKVEDGKESEKSLAKLEAEIATLKETVTKFVNSPMPVKARAYATVEKFEDPAGGSAELAKAEARSAELQKALQTSNDSALIKEAGELGVKIMRLRRERQ